MNDFSQLSAERPDDRLAQMTPEEQAEYNVYLDQQREQQFNADAIRADALVEKMQMGYKPTNAELRWLNAFNE